jgi:hypothetical protein
MQLDTAVRKDRQLQQAEGDAILGLMEHRNIMAAEHGVREYARAVGVSHEAIRVYARAYELWWKDSEGGNRAVARTPGDYLGLAKVTGDQRIALDAVAEAKGVAVQTAERHHRAEVKRVKQAIADEPDTDRRQRKAQSIAQSFEANHQRQSNERQTRRANKTRAYLDLERELDKARRALAAALTIASEAKLDNDCMELITDSAGKVKSLLKLIDLAVTGKVEIDWDAEMKRLVS